MNHNEQLSEMDGVERAAEALKRSTIPEGPTPELIASTVDVLNASGPSITRTQLRSKWLMRIAGFSGVAAAVALVASIIGSLFFMDRSAPYAFADVIDNVKKAKSVILTCKQKFGKQPEFDFIWYIQGEHLRMEIPGQMAMIADLKKKKGIQLNYFRKTYKFMPVHADAAKGFMNPLQQLRKLRSKDAKKLKQEKIGGKNIDVFQMNKIDLFGMKGEGEMTLWVDPKTQLPVKIKVQANTMKGAKGKPYDTTIVFDDFTWNENIDLAQFSLEVPKGFTLEKQ